MSEDSKKEEQSEKQDISTYLGKKITRRKAIGTGAAVGMTVAGLVVGGAAGYFAGGAGAAGAAKTVTQTSTVTAGGGAASTITQTVTQTATQAGGSTFGQVNGSQLKYTFVTHGGEENVFWNTVNKGMQEAASLLGVSAVMIRPTTEGDQAQISANWESTIASKPDGIIGTVVYPNILDEIKKATAAGIPVVISNIDSANAQDRINAGGLSYIGQSLTQAGNFLAKTLSTKGPGYPSGSRAVILIEGPGQSWAEQRSTGITQFLKEQNITFDRLNVKFDAAVVESSLTAYLEANPDTKAIFSVGYMAWVAEKSMKAVNKAPGTIAVGGFDLVPDVLTAIQDGYMTMTLDQQPYLQGFLPIVQLALKDKYLLGAWDVNTGNAVVDKSNVGPVVGLSKNLYR